jgi:mono/diheme cytochrome c family protein
MSNLHRSWLVLGLLAVALLVTACEATQSTRLIEADAAQGRTLWVASGCGGCHGLEAQGDRAGPALVNTPLISRDVINIVRRGTPGMPEYPASDISDQDLLDMYAWLQNPVPAATPDLGQNPWTQSPCVGCHGAGAEGGIGPGLAGSSQSFAAFQSVVRQGAEGMPAYSAGQIGDAALQRMYDWLQAQATVPAEPGAVWAGTGCGGCHGAEAEGGTGPALAGGEYDYEAFQQVVRQGAEGMPAYSAGQIGDAQLQRMYDWLQAQATVPVEPGAVWAQTGCGGCHGAEAEGGTGPALTGEEYDYEPFQQVVRQGAEGMPAYGTGQIGDADLRRIYEWLRAGP